MRKAFLELAHQIGGWARCLQSVVKAIEPWGIAVAVIGLGVTFVGMITELEDRQAERVFRAWEVVLNSQGKRSGSGPRQALEYLNREYNGWGCGSWIRYLSVAFTGWASRECLVPKKRREFLDFMDLSNTILNDAVLEDASLSFANLSGAFLIDANLKNAVLAGANMESARLLGAKLNGVVFDPKTYFVTTNLPANDERLPAANLKNAILRDADLVGADFGRANLTGAKLIQADISNATLDEVIGLTQEMVDKACGAVRPDRLPIGIEWKGKVCQRNQPIGGINR